MLNITTKKELKLTLMLAGWEVNKLNTITECKKRDHIITFINSDNVIQAYIVGTHNGHKICNLPDVIHLTKYLTDSGLI